MANHKSAKKRAIRNEKKRIENKSRLSKIRTFVKKVKVLITENKKDEAIKALSTANSEIAKGAKKGVMHKKTASRMVSKLAKKVAEIK